MNLIEYKKEYTRHISLIIDEALIIALGTLVDKKVLDLETFDLIKNDLVTIDEFERHLLTRREFVKSSRELLKEFEKVRGTINDYLKEIDWVNSIDTESSVDSNKITILRQFAIPKEFIMDFFGVDEKDMIQLMKKKGFVEKFAVLRMNKVFKEIYGEMHEEQYITQGYSLVYFNANVTGFSIDYKYHLNVDFIANDGNMRSIIKRIREIDKVVERKFNKKMGLNFYEQSKEKTNDFIDKTTDSYNEPNELKIDLNSKDNTILILEEEKRPEKKESIKIETFVKPEVNQVGDTSSRVEPKIEPKIEPKTEPKTEPKVQTKIETLDPISPIKETSIKPIEQKTMKEIVEKANIEHSNEKPKDFKVVNKPLNENKNIKPEGKQVEQNGFKPNNERPSLKPNNNKPNPNYKPNNDKPSFKNNNKPEENNPAKTIPKAIDKLADNIGVDIEMDEEVNLIVGSGKAMEVQFDEIDDDLI